LVDSYRVHAFSRGWFLHLGQLLQKPVSVAHTATVVFSRWSTSDVFSSLCPTTSSSTHHTCATCIHIWVSPRK
jgi:hypothetical protein